jgi:hypothetical protein
LTSELGLRTAERTAQLEAWRRARTRDGESWAIAGDLLKRAARSNFEPGLVQKFADRVRPLIAATDEPLLREAWGDRFAVMVVVWLALEAVIDVAAAVTAFRLADAKESA